MQMAEWGHLEAGATRPGPAGIGYLYSIYTAGCQLVAVLVGPRGKG
jgi:hypothetical protein